MSSTLTYPELQAVVEELQQLTMPAGVQKVFEQDDGAIVLQLRRPGATRFLLIDCHGERGRIHMVESKPRQPERPSAFVMLLRKHLVGAGFTGLDLQSDDRVVSIRFQRKSDDGVVPLDLIVELSGRTANAFLLTSGKVLGIQYARRPRGHRVGAEYTAIRPVRSQVGEDRIGLRDLPVGERSGAVESWVAEHVTASSASGLRVDLSARLRREGKRLRRLVRNLEGDLQRAEDAQDAKRRGELLQSAYGLAVSRGAKSVRVPDYYVEGSPEVDVPLDPAKSLQDNIERYFHAYRRMNAAQSGIEGRLLAAMERLAELEVALADVGECSDEELVKRSAELAARGLLGKRRAARRKAQQRPTLPFRTFIARSGAKILVGRGSKHNDTLTTRIARGRDVWLHARDWAGAHVLLRMEKDGEPHGEDLRDAALLAAHFSKGTKDSLVDVTFTRAKHVRKPKGAAPGMVTVAAGSTLAVPQDPDRLAELFAGEERDD